MTEQQTHERVVHGKIVHGIDVDEETRCAHWHGADDVIALRMHCCKRWFPCYECHEVLVADHSASPWPRAQREAEAVLCGACGKTLQIDEYLVCQSRCPDCAAAFNPGCVRHWHLYFDIS